MGNRFPYDLPRSSMNRAGMAWEHEETEQLEWMFRDGRNYGDIARVLKRSSYAIVCKLKSLGYDIEERKTETRTLEGTFWMIQNGELSGAITKYGNETVSWPGASVYLTEEAAMEAAKNMARENPRKKFFIMKSVALVAVELPIDVKVLY